jgi:APA family basic amino acid/polyamine antiporter
VGTATLRVIFPGAGTSVMAAAIMVSTFGTINALTLTGARVYYAMARQKLPICGRIESIQRARIGSCASGSLGNLSGIAPYL